MFFSTSSMDPLSVLGFILCLTFVSSQAVSETTDCLPLFEACDQVYEASQKDMVQVNNYYNCLNRPHICHMFQDEDRERRIVKLKEFVANVCPSCRLGERMWSTPMPDEDEMSAETCENQIFSCTTSKMDGMMTRYDMLQYQFVCVQRPTECSSSEEVLRQAVSKTIQNEMAMACPDCLVPNLPPSMTMEDMQPQEFPCLSLLTLCNTQFNVKGRNYRSFESLYMCVAKITNCEGDREMTLRQQQMDVLVMTLHSMCPTCDMPVPTPPKERTCLESVYYCSIHGIYGNSTVRFNALRKVHQCALDLDECDSVEENNLRFHLVKSVRMEMEYECGHCDLPELPHELQDSVNNAMPPRQHNCRDAITSCQSIFHIRARRRRSYEEMYDCFHVSDNCTPNEMNGMMGPIGPGMDQMDAMEVDMDEAMGPMDMVDQSLPLVKRRRRSLMPQFQALPPQTMAILERQHGCYNDTVGCKQEFDAGPRTCGDRMGYLNCLTNIQDCEGWEERIQKRRISEQVVIIRKKCVLKKIRSSTERRRGRMSCTTAFSSCSRVFYSSYRNESSAMQFNHCLREPHGCEGWEESYRDDMIQTAMNYLPTPEFRYQH